MNGFMLVALGGAMGACARYSLGLVTSQSGHDGWWATLIVNVVVSALMGCLVAWLAVRGPLMDQGLWLLFGVGVLGAFTTFSSFSKDAMELLLAGEAVTALAYIIANMVGSIGAFALALLSLKRVFI